MKKIVVLFLMFVLFASAAPAQAAQYAKVSSVEMSGAVLTVTGVIPARATVYTKIVKSGDVINVYVFQRGGCPSCGYGVPYTKQVNLRKYLDPTRAQKILVNGTVMK